METLVIQSNSKAHIKILFDLAKQLGDKPTIEKTKIKALTGANKTKFNSIEKEFAKSLNSVKLIKSGKLKPNKLSDLLNGKV
jgi:hypothetical protein